MSWAFVCRSSASSSPTTFSLSPETILMPKRSAIPASGHASAILVPLLLGLRDGRAGSWFFRLGGRGRSRQMSDDLLGDQLVAGGGEMDAVDAAQTLRHPNAILAIGRVLSVLVGDDGPQRHEL